MIQANLLVRRKLRSMMAVDRLEVGRAHLIPTPWASSHLNAKQALGRVIKSTNSLVAMLLGPNKQYVRFPPLTSSEYLINSSVQVYLVFVLLAVFCCCWWDVVLRYNKLY